MKVTIAVEGCCHGDLDKIYATLQLLEQREGKKIDLLICCGDFQAVRNLDDLETMACPPKYRDMQSFYKYYSGEKVAPFPTVFVGGNHEAANHLWELYYGGWAAPNIYFLGFAGAVRFGGLRIAGLSGIYNQRDYMRGHHEALPYSDSTMRSIYHVRDFEVYKLLQLQQPVDIFVSHDWPTNIAWYGNTAQLLARKSFLRAEVENGTLGSPPGAQLLGALRPSYWFAAHLHTKFAALVQHPPREQQPQQPQQQATAGAEGSAPGPQAGGGSASTTRFLALDKCLPGRDFLQLIELDAPGPPELHYDEEWLSVLRSTHHLTNLAFRHAPLPGMGALRTGPRPEDAEFVRQVLADRGTSRVPDNFTATVEPYNPAHGQRKGRMPQRHTRNPQTVALLDMLGLPYNLDHADVSKGPPGPGPSSAAAAATAPQPATALGAGNVARRAPLSLAPQLQVGRPQPGPAAPGPVLAPNPEEIDLGDLSGEEEEEEEQAGEQRPQQQPQEGAEGAPSVSDVGSGGVDGSGGNGDGGGGPAVQGLGDSVAQTRLEEDPMFQPVGL